MNDDEKLLEGGAEEESDLEGGDGLLEAFEDSEELEDLEGGELDEDDEEESSDDGDDGFGFGTEE